MYIPCWLFQYLSSITECAFAHFLPLAQLFTGHCSAILAGGFRTRQRPSLDISYTAFTLPTNWCSYGLKQCNHNNRNAELYLMKQAAHTCPTRQSISGCTFKLQSKAKQKMWTYNEQNWMIRIPTDILVTTLHMHVQKSFNV